MDNTKQSGLSQEGLKLIACISMLIDHCTVTLFYSYMKVAADPALASFLYNILRIPGLISFPIFAFLLVEGAHHTRNPKNYATRLVLVALLSEVPFRLAFSKVSFGSSNVMFTLLLGFLMIQAIGRMKGFWKFLVVIPFYLISDWIPMDHGGEGILLIAMLELTYGITHQNLWRLGGFCALFIDSTRWNVGYEIMLPIKRFALFALIPILCYRGHKCTYSKKVQWAFYLFYPVHIFLLWGINTLIFA